VRIALFGWQRSIDYSQIGGTESIARRIARVAARQGFLVDYIMFGAQTVKQQRTKEGFGLKYFSTIQQALTSIKRNKYTDVLVFYIPPRVRPVFALFRMVTADIRFHKVVTSVNTMPLKRYLYSLDLFLAYDNVFAISPSMTNFFQQIGLNATLILPPVPKEYFVDIDEGVKHGPIKVAYLGRADFGKGTDIAFEVLDGLSKDPAFKASAMVYAWDDDPTSQEILAQGYERNFDLTVRSYRGYHPSIELEIVKFLSKTDVMLFPFRSNTNTISSPLSLLEACAAQCYVITTDVGDIPWLAGSTNYVLPLEKWSVSNIRNHLSQIDLNEKRREIRKHVLELGFDSETVFDTLKSHFK